MMRSFVLGALLALVIGGAAECAPGAECESRTGKTCAEATQGDDCVNLACKGEDKTVTPKVKGVCTPCQSTADCGSSSLVCTGLSSTPASASALWLTKLKGTGKEVNAANTGGRCEHKALFPMDQWDWITLVLVILACILAASGGIGGGGLLVPLYILVSGFAANSASPLSSATITGGGFANYYSYSTRLHPNFDKGVHKPLIDYDTALLIMPALLLGTLYGTLLNKILPEWLFLALMFILMIKYSIRTTNKGRRLYKKETEERAEMAAAKEAETAASSSQVVVVAGSASATDVGAEPIKTGDVAGALESPRSARTNSEARRDIVYFPRKQLLITLGAWILTFVIALFKGKAGSASAIGVQCNTGGYWATIIVGSILLIVITAYIRKVVLDGIAKNGASGDIKWDAENTIKYPAICVVCGIMAGLMGIGGGMVVGPLLIELGVVPQVVAATSAYTVVITASSATVQFMVMGSLQYDYGGFFAAVGLVTTFFGQWVVDGMIKKYNRASVIVFAIAAIMVIATVLLGYTGIEKVIRQVDNGSSLGLKPLCT
jgi:uncharacterized membrane protein YfcA